MQLSKPVRTDLVISMTLAEIFLLLLFVVWWGVGSAGADVTTQLIQIEQLKNDLAKIRSERDSLKAKADDLERQMAWFKDNYGMPPPSSPEEDRKFRLALGRGKPPCQENDNLLVAASVVDGHQTVRVLTPAPGLVAIMGDWGISHLHVGSQLTDADDIDHLLAGVARYRVVVKEKDREEQRECRFDYRLTYGTYKDYYDARERFEKRFYSASRAPAPGYQTKE